MWKVDVRFDEMIVSIVVSLDLVDIIEGVTEDGMV